MQVTRDVVLDLLPAYLANEASPDTQALVREYLDSDPELARLAQQWRQRMPEPPPAPARADAQAQAYQAAQRQLTWRVLAVAGLITGGVLALLGLIAVFFFVPVR